MQTHPRLNEGKVQAARPPTQGAGGGLAGRATSWGVALAWCVVWLMGCPVQKTDLPVPATTETAQGEFPPKPTPPKIAQGPLQVVRVTPEGDKDVVQAVSVTFDQPYVPLASLAELDKVPPPLELTPKVAGRYRWLGTKTVSFVPDEELPAATQYTARVKAGSQGLAAGPLAQDVSWSFRTRLPQVVSIAPSSYEARALPDARIVLQFNQAIDPASVLERLKVEANGKAVPFELVPRPKGETGNPDADREGLGDRRVELVPKVKLPLNAQVTVTLKEGFKGTQGPLAASAPYASSFRTYGPLTVGSVECWGARCSVQGYAWLRLSNPLAPDAAKHITVKPPLPQGTELSVYGDSVSVAGPLAPDTKYDLVFGAGLTDAFGQKLGKATTRSFLTTDYAPKFALDGWVSVLEAGGPRAVALQAINVPEVSWEAQPVRPDEIARAWRWLHEESQERRWEQGWFSPLPAMGGERTKGTVATAAKRNEVVDRAIPLDGALVKKLGGAFLVQARAQVSDKRWRPTSQTEQGLVHVTDLGLQAWSDYGQSLVWVTGLSDAKPASGAKVVLRDYDGKQRWEGQTDAQGVVSAPGPSKLEGPGPWFLTAERGDAWAFVVLDGSAPLGGQWLYSYTDAANAPTEPRLVGHIFSERGIYRPGELVHLKGTLRLMDRLGVHGMPDKLKKVQVRVEDAVGGELASQEVELSATGSFALDVRPKADAPLGYYRVLVTPDALDKVRPGVLEGGFSVEAYRAPEFAVEVQATKADLIKGEPFEGEVSGQYLFGAPMRGAQAHWILQAEPGWFSAPGYPGFSFDTRLTWEGGKTLEDKTLSLDAQGKARLTSPLAFEGGPDAWSLSVSSEVFDVNRQVVAGQTRAMLHPAEAYFGLKLNSWIFKTGEELVAEVIAVKVGGERADGVSGALKLQRGEWKAETVARDGRTYTEWKEIWSDEGGACAVTTGAQPRECRFKPSKGGQHRLVIEGKDGQGRAMRGVRGFWVAGGDWVPRGDEVQVKVMLDKELYKPGDVARVLITSPFPKARARLSLGRLGLVRHLDLGEIGASHLVELPIEAGDVPNLWLTAALVKPRTAPHPTLGADDPGKPAVLLGRAQALVDVSHKTIQTKVSPQDGTARPGEVLPVEVETLDLAGKPVSAEVMLTLVDEGVLSLIGYQTPDPVAAFWGPQPSELTEVDARAWLADGRAQAPKEPAQHVEPLDGKGDLKKSEREKMAKPQSKAVMIESAELRLSEDAPSPVAEAPPAEPSAGLSDEEGGGGAPGATARVRNRFETTPYYAAMLKTDAQGKLKVDIKLPDNLTRFRIMAVVQEGEDRFGSAQGAVAVRQPLLLRPSLPRFANLGDEFEAVVAVNNESGQDGELAVALSTDKGPTLRLVGPNEPKRVKVAKGQAVEVGFPVKAERPGETTFTFRATFTGGGQTHEDAVEARLNVQIPASREAVATYGSTEGAIGQALHPPGEVLEDVGGLDVSVSSTMLTNLHDAIGYLVEYPYGCLEQTSSRLLPLLVLRELVLKYNIGGLDVEGLDRMLADGVAKLVALQRYSGGFAFWPESSYSSPWGTAWATFILGEARRRDREVPSGVMDQAVEYLARVANDGQDPEHWRPVGHVTQVFAAWVLSLEAPQRLDPNRALEPLFVERAQLPLFARAMLAMAYQNLKLGADDRVAVLLRELSDNTVDEASDTHFAEPKQDLWVEYFHSDNRTDAIGLMAFLQARPQDPLVEPVARGLMQARVRGRWNNTQENAWALLALSRYADVYEKEVPDFMARVWVGSDFVLGKNFQGRDTGAAQVSVPMKALASQGDSEVVVAREGKGRLYYRLGMTYVPRSLDLPAREEGFTISREYETIEVPQSQPQGGAEVKAPAGQYVRVKLSFVVPTERHWVVVDDPLPAGAEPVNLDFKTTMATLSSQANTTSHTYRWSWYWEPQFDHIEQRDDRVLLFADRLWPGVYEYSYLIRTTTPGSFYLPPSHISEMYQPETFGRTASGRFVIER